MVNAHVVIFGSLEGWTEIKFLIYSIDCNSSYTALS